MEQQPQCIAQLFIFLTPTLLAVLQGKIASAFWVDRHLVFF